MKSTLIFIFTISSALGIRSQTVTSNCTAKDSIVRIWKKSADKLACRRVVYIGNTYKDSVAINKQLSDAYLKALLAVYNATALAARDTIMIAPIVLDYYYPNDVNYISVALDSTKLWTQNLKNNIIPCGNVGIDNLINKYYLKKVSYLSLFNTYSYHLVSFRTDSNCFIDRLCDRFNGLYLQGVVFCGPGNENRSDAFHITDSVNTNFTELTYSYGWGGCMIPCMYRRYWKFRVYNDCSVEYKGSYGQTLPFNPFNGLNENNWDSATIVVYPNPSTAKITVELSALKVPVEKVELINSIGQTIYIIKNPGEKLEIDIRPLSEGIYFLKVYNRGQLKLMKVLKQ